MRRPGNSTLEAGTDRTFTVSTKSTKRPKSSPSAKPAAQQDDPVVASFRDKREVEGDLAPQTSEADLQLLATQLERLKQHLEDLPEVDATRVIQIYNRLQAGDYQVDANRLAEKLTALESALDKP